MQVRRANVDDRNAYLGMVRQFHAEGAFPFALDMARQNAIFDIAISDGNMRLWLAISETGQRVGFLLAGVSTAALSGERVAAEHMIWVDRPWRGGNAFYRLVRAFLAWSEAVGYDRMLMTTQISMKPEETGRLYERLGFQKTEVHYTRRS